MANQAMIGLSALGPMMGGIGANRAARAEAAALDEDARLTELQGNLDSASAMRESRAAMGEMIAASGSDPGSGSMADIIRQSLIEREFEKMSILYSAGGKAAQKRNQATQSRAAGNAALVGGLVNAGASALGAYRENKSRAELKREQDRLYSAQRSGFIPVPGGQLMPRADGTGYGFDPLARLRRSGYGN